MRSILSDVGSGVTSPPDAEKLASTYDRPGARPTRSSSALRRPRDSRRPRSFDHDHDHATTTPRRRRRRARARPVHARSFRPPCAPVHGQGRRRGRVEGSVAMNMRSSALGLRSSRRTSGVCPRAPVATEGHDRDPAVLPRESRSTSTCRRESIEFTTPNVLAIYDASDARTSHVHAVSTTPTVSP